MDTEEFIKRVIDCAYKVRLQLAPGYLESVYKKALCIELEKNGFTAKSEYPINVYYDNIVVGEFRADILVDDKLVIELKAVQNLCTAHEAQMVNYLTATNIDNGLLINFGADRIEIKRKYRCYRSTKK